MHNSSISIPIFQAEDEQMLRLAVTERRTGLKTDRLKTVAIIICILSPAFGARTAEGQTVEPLLEEVVVTARKREESIRDIPVAVTAISAEKLEIARIDSPVDMIGRVPSLFMSQSQGFGPNSNQSYLVLRGVGATSSFEPSVAVFVDGVYMPSRSFDLGFVDLERVELLRGPQGSLFGRNTEGGALNISTRKPGPETEAKIQFEFDENETYIGRASASGALGDNTYAGVSVEYLDTAGFIENLALGGDHNEHDRFSGRLSVLTNLSETTSLYLTAFSSERDGGVMGWGVDDTQERFVSTENLAGQFQDISTNAFSATLELETAPADLTAILGFNEIETQTRYDHDGGSVSTGNLQDQTADQRLASFEFRATSSSDSKSSWIVGLYGFDQEDTGRRDFLFPDGTGSVFPPLFDPNALVDESYSVERSGWAVFGQFSFVPNDQLELTLGARYSDEDVDAVQNGVVDLSHIGIFDQYGGESSTSFDDLSFSGSFAYRYSDNSLFYGSISQGYKAGGFEFYAGDTPSVGLSFDSESSLNFEIGLKSSWLGGAVTTDLAAFHILIDDQQLVTERTGANGLPIGSTDNVGESHSTGLEAELLARLSESFTLSLGASFVDTEFDEYVTDTGTDRSGQSFPYVPELTAYAALEVQKELKAYEGWSFVGSLSARYVDDYFTGNDAPPFDPTLSVDSYSIVDIQAGLENENWGMAVFVDNLLDEFAVTQRFQPPFQVYTRGQVLPPATVGIRVSYRY